MLKFILLLSLSFFIVGCSSDANTSDSSNTNTLSITKAPIATGVDITNLLAVEFSNSIDISLAIDSLTLQAPSYPIDGSSPIYLVDANGVVVNATLTLDTNNSKKVLIAPNKYLEPSSTYSIVVTTALEDVDGNSLSEDAKLSFTTDDQTANPGGNISFVDINPRDGSTTDVIPTAISLGFSRDVAISELAMFEVKDDVGTLVSGVFTYFNSKVTFIPITPLSVGVTYTINMINRPTDMYGNGYDNASRSSWSFTVDNTLIAPFILDATLDRGDLTGHMIRGFANVAGDFPILAVARDGGIDFYYYSNATFTKTASLSIASEITDMQHIVNTTNFENNLLISTKSDGIFLVDINVDVNNSYTLRTFNYLQSVGEIYGVGYGDNLTGNVDRIYAVGPDIGMKIFDASNGASSLVEMTPVAISGKPLKVIGYRGISRHIFVTDYENGLRSFDENGTTPILHDTISKDIKYMDNVTPISTSELKVVSNIGNIYTTDPENLGEPTFEYSINGDIVDEDTDGYYLYIATKNGLYTYDPNLTYLSYLPVVDGLKSVTIMPTGEIMILSATGFLYAYSLISQ